MYEHVHVYFDKRVQVQAGGSKGGGINHKEDNNVEQGRGSMWLAGWPREEDGRRETHNALH